MGDVSLEARAWLYVESSLRYPVKRVKYITDIKEDPVSCKQEELFDVLHKGYRFSHGDTDYINDMLNSARGVILNLVNNEIIPRNQEPVLIKTEKIRDPNAKPEDARLRGLQSKEIEKLVHSKFFNK